MVDWFLEVYQWDENVTQSWYYQLSLTFSFYLYVSINQYAISPSYPHISHSSCHVKNIVLKQLINFFQLYGFSVAWATCCIRYWTALTEEMLKQNPDRARPKWFRKRIFTILNYRNTHLKYLNMHDSAEFDRVVKTLKLAYHVPKPHDKDRQFSNLTRKIWTEKMLRKRVVDEKEKKLKALHEQVIVLYFHLYIWMIMSEIGRYPCLSASSDSTKFYAFTTILILCNKFGQIIICERKSNDSPNCKCKWR